MQNIFLFFTTLLALGISNFTEIETRDYSEVAWGRLTKVAVSPASIISGGQTIDFATTSGWEIYFGNFVDQEFKFEANVTKYYIDNMIWTKNGLHVYSAQEIKVIEFHPSFSIKLSIETSKYIDGVAFGFSQASSKILAAVSYKDQLEIFLGNVSIFNYTLERACYAMSFDSTGEYLRFVSNYYNHTSYFNLLHIPTLALVEKIDSFKREQFSLSFSPIEGYRNLSVSCAQSDLILWNGSSISSVKLTEEMMSVNFVSNGAKLIGPLLLNEDCIAVLDFDMNTSTISSNISQKLRFGEYRLLDFDTNRNYIVAVTVLSRIVIIQGKDSPSPSPPPPPPPEPEPSESSKTWIIVVGVIVGFLLVVGVAGVVIIRRRKNREAKWFIPETE